MLRVVNRIAPRATSLRALSTEKPKVPKKSKEEIMKEKTPAGKLDDLKPYEDPYLKKHPGGVNPVTGEDFYQDAFMESKHWIEIVHVLHFTTILVEHSSPSCICEKFTVFSIFVNGAEGFSIILVASSVRNTT
ncbi:hypothetical protein Y032_0008g278 [Ancylostoma ceylanicum]|uniref:Succinate dehydrogenase assembly factor 4, mitochondrial n=1 Tax=Ancylostoma ceylanicum TaxID=53326 RepID=A0A016VL36_9BILA|nr:hypothetical protein Y032_0008g278 [Ancylostoma ceylanicum]